MCYSALVESQYQRYLRETGAEIDIAQFEEIYGMRIHDSSIRILRGVDRWFDEPRSDGERQIRGMIELHNAAMIKKLEQDIFGYRKRIADAERKLAVKPTKGAASDRRIATTKAEKAQRDLTSYTGSKATPLDSRIFSLRYGPIIMNVDGRNVIRLARYHLRRPGDPPGEDRAKPGLYNARRDNLQAYWRKQFGHTHAVLLMNSFFEHVDRPQGSVELHFKPRGPDLMRVACLQALWLGPNGEKMPCFSAVTDDPPPEVAAAGHNRCPINLKPEHVNAWLTPEGRSADELLAILGDRQTPYYEHEVLAA